MDSSDLLGHAELAFMGLFSAVGKVLSAGSKTDGYVLGVLIWLEMPPRCLCVAESLTTTIPRLLGKKLWGEEDGADAVDPE